MGERGERLLEQVACEGTDGREGSGEEVSYRNALVLPTFSHPSISIHLGCLQLCVALRSALCQAKRVVRAVNARRFPGHALWCGSLPECEVPWSCRSKRFGLQHAASGMRCKLGNASELEHVLTTRFSILQMVHLQGHMLEAVTQKKDYRIDM